MPVLRVLHGLALLAFGIGFRNPRGLDDVALSSVEMDTVDKASSVEMDTVEAGWFRRRSRRREGDGGRRRDRRRATPAPPTPAPPTPAPTAPPTPAPPIDCDGVVVRPDPQGSNQECCQVTVEGFWKQLKSLAREETLTIEYGFKMYEQTYDLDKVYRHSMVQAALEFQFRSINGTIAYSGDQAAKVVDECYMNETVVPRMTWTGTWNSENGRYLYQWRWKTKFTPVPIDCNDPGDVTVTSVGDSTTAQPGSPQCLQCDHPDVVIATHTIVQADTPPKCVPGDSEDPQYQVCAGGGIST